MSDTSWMERDGTSELPYMVMGGGGVGQASSKNHMKNFHQTLLGDQRLEHFCTEGRTSLHCWKVNKIPEYG